MIIAIDGPSGSGKSSVAADVAKKLKFNCLDTGAMYRSIAYVALKNNVDLNDEDALVDICQNNKISFKNISNNLREVYINSKNVTKEIRTKEINKAVTPVCKLKRVRHELTKQQRDICKSDNYVVEGRDIGSVVFPDADLKIYLFADIEECAKRRFLQNKRSGFSNVDYDKVLNDLKRRDFEDSNRDVAPLTQVEDAIKIDSTNLTQQEVVDRICDLWKKIEERNNKN